MSGQQGRNIVLLSDGTGNSAGKLQKTNVWRLYQALDLLPPDAPDRPDQIAYYDDGVGSSSFKLAAILGGAFGWGLKRNVLDLYKFLCRNYRDDDRIYLFGFSRGAFTIRVLAGLIVNRGIVHAASEAELNRMALDEFREYREARYESITRAEVVGRMMRNAVGMLKPGEPTRVKPNTFPRVRFVGAWDTVAAYGLPFDELTRAWDAVFPLSMPERNLSDKVDRACHAVALDDERNTFHPVLWNEQGHPQTNAYGEERLTQVWFTGMHANVGGGYDDDALSNVSLTWMIRQARGAGLAFKTLAVDDIATAAHIDGRMYDSRAGVGSAYRYLPRKMKPLLHDVDDPKDQVVITRPKIHHSVFDRLHKGSGGYAPIVLPGSYALMGADDVARDLTPDEAKIAAVREERQEQAWNLVWLRRIVYFSAVAVGIALAAFPLFAPAKLACTEWLCGLSWAIGLLGVVLPDFLHPWLMAWETHPSAFLGLVVGFAVLLSVGGTLRTKISDTMRAIWMTPNAPSAGLDGLAKFRLSPGYVRTWKTLKYVALPVIVGVIALFFIGAGVSRGLFTVVDGAGWICGAARSHTAGRFDTRDVCWRAADMVREGARYRITITVVDPWDDNGIPTGVQGFRRVEGHKLMYAGMLLRRHLGEPWYKPFARIGGSGTDEYPLNGDGYADTTPSKLVAEIVARRSGPLYIYVNDAVTPIPGWQPMYDNNHGTATVKVEEVQRAPLKAPAQ